MIQTRCTERASRAIPKDTGERGATLLLVVLLMFGILGIAALTIDLGLASLSRSQLRSAADPAAIEGLRARDRLGVVDPASDQARRQEAANFIALSFDDDLGATTGGTLVYGAGGILTGSGGVGEANALETLDVDGVTPYVPTPELNLLNLAQGNFVAGEFDETAATHEETEAYVRDDFAPATTVDAPASTSFLVRLQRTNDFQGLDNQAGVSSSGPALPFLFGRGALTAGADPTAGYSPRHHGMTVRAVAIAGEQRVVSVGLAQDAFGIEGALPIALDRTFWNGVAPGASVSLTYDAATAELLSAGVPVGVRAEPTSLLHIGDPLVPQLGAWVDATGFTAVTTAVGAVPTDRIVGFGSAQITAVSATEILLQKTASRVAPQNATAQWLVSMPTLDSALWQAVLVEHRIVADPLLAPALVR